MDSVKFYRLLSGFVASFQSLSFTFVCPSPYESSYLYPQSFCHSLFVLLYVFHLFFFIYTPSPLCPYHCISLLYRHVSEPFSTLDAMLRSKVLQLSSHIQYAYIHNAAKLFSRLLVDGEHSDDREGCLEVTKFMLERIPMFESSSDLEVQERVCILR